MVTLLNTSVTDLAGDVTPTVTTSFHATHVTWEMSCLFKEEKVPHHTSPLPSERNIHAVIRGIPASFSEQEIKEELERKGYSPHHIIRLKRSSGVPMPLAVVILPKVEKSQQVFNEHELLV
nr:unnamed protein product [Callosobruchus chinensis]